MLSSDHSDAPNRMARLQSELRLLHQSLIKNGYSHNLHQHFIKLQILLRNLQNPTSYPMPNPPLLHIHPTLYTLILPHSSTHPPNKTVNRSPSPSYLPSLLSFTTLRITTLPYPTLNSSLHIPSYPLYSLRNH